MDGFDLTKYQEEGEEKDKIKKIMGKFFRVGAIMKLLKRQKLRKL